MLKGLPNASRLCHLLRHRVARAGLALRGLLQKAAEAVQERPHHLAPGIERPSSVGGFFVQPKASFGERMEKEPLKSRAPKGFEMP